MFCDLCWNHIAIQVNCKQKDYNTDKLIDAAITIFCEKSKKAYYTQKIGSTSAQTRKNWQLISSCRMEGSANPQVMRYLKNLFENDFTTIAIETGSIKSVSIEIQSNEFEIEIEVGNGE
jgi:hypothetical protein